MCNTRYSNPPSLSDRQTFDIAAGATLLVWFLFFASLVVQATGEQVLIMLALAMVVSALSFRRLWRWFDSL